uniref:Uncharacterized protein n=1 Tax=Amphimedon queenslandica TaxID=400682 RepID=A0A1X7U413_AMPQE
MIKRGKPVVYYHSVTPAANLFLQKKWDEKMYDIHRRNVMSAKARIDNRLSDFHIKFNFHLKDIRKQSEKRRQEEIAKLNQEMLRNILNVKGQISRFIGTNPPVTQKTRSKSATVRSTKDGNGRTTTTTKQSRLIIRPQTAPLQLRKCKVKTNPPWY